MTAPLRVALRKTSLVDFPGKVAAVVFFPLCNLRCPWCHNGPLVAPEPVPETAGMFSAEKDGALVEMEAALSLIERRRALLGGVVFSGGEPLLQRELGAFIRRVKEAGLPVKLDTNGTIHGALGALLSEDATRPDYVAFDLKLAPGRYGELRPVPRDGGEPAAELERGARLLAGSGIPHEFRSLALPDGHFSSADIQELAPLVDGSPWFFSPFRPGSCLDPAWDSRKAASFADAGRLAEFARSLGKDAAVRGGPR